MIRTYPSIGRNWSKSSAGKVYHTFDIFDSLDNQKYRRIGHFAGCKRVSVSLWVILQAGRDTPLKTSSFGIA